MAGRSARIVVVGAALSLPISMTVAVVSTSVAHAGTPPSSISLTGTARDFEYGNTAPVCSNAVNPDFQSSTLGGDDHGITTTTLGDDGTPGYAGGAGGTNATTGPGSFAQWYHDVPGTNISIPVTIKLDRDATTGVYSYSNSLFFPLDGKGWSNGANCPSSLPNGDGQTDLAQYVDTTTTPNVTLNDPTGARHNFSFTYQIHTTFTYNGGETFDFAGDDDIWVYMHGYKVLDLGGLHPRESSSVALDDIASKAGMTKGGTYAFDLFFAERHTTASSFVMSTTLDLSPLAVSGLSAQSVSATTPPAVTSVDINNIPSADLPAAAADGVASAPLRSVPLRSVGVTDSPLRSVPLRSVPLRSVPLRSVPLRSVLLSQVPLIGTTWAQVLGEDVPLETTTLDDALNRLDATGADGPTMDQVDLSNTPLNMSVASIFLGATQLDQLPIMPPPTGDTGSNYGNWCAWFQSLGYSCSSLGITSTSPLLAADLSGVPLRSVPLRSVPLRSVPVGAPLRSVPLRSVDIANSPLRSVPLRSVQLLAGGTPTAFGAIPLSALSPDSGIARTAIAPSLTSLVSCTGCATLGGAINANATGSLTLSDLATLIAGSTLTLGDLTPLTSAISLKVGDLADDLTDDSVSLADVLMALLPPSEVPWESIPLSGLDLSRYADPHVTYFAISAHLSGGLDTASGHISFDMPSGFHFADVTGDFPEGASVDGHAVGSTVTLSLTGFPVPSTLNLQVGLAPAEALGAYSLANLAASFTSTNDGSASATGSETDAGIRVIDPNINAESPSPIQPDHLVFGWISQPSEVNTYELPAPPAGTRIHVLLSHLPTDDDLVMYGQLNASSPSAAPLRSVPLRSVPLLDSSIGTSNTSGGSTPQLLNDVPLQTERPVIGESAQPGTGDEEVDAQSVGAVANGGGLLIQVTGYNGGSSGQPYVLRVVEDTPQSTSCPTIGDPTQQSADGVLPSVVDLATTTAPTAHTRSLFLINSQQMSEAYPSGVTGLVTALQTVAQRADVAGAVLPVDTDPAVRLAYNTWNADPCDTTAANNVVYAVQALVQHEVAGPSAPAPNVTSVVLLGADSQLPMFRLPDLTFSTNEIGYADSDTGSNGDNPLSAAQRHEDMLTDDVYGSLHPVSWLQNPLFVPDLAVGRLVETPDEITAQLNQFSAAGGRLTPASSLTTGYDFLADGAHAVDSALSNSGAIPHTTLIDDPGSTSAPWTHAQLDAALFPSGTGAESPYVDSINAHFDHNRALPSAGNATGNQSDLFTVSDITANTGRLVGRLLFSMGCHAGLNVPDTYLSPTADTAMAKDWAQTFANQNAVWVANTGFGLGDTDSVALSEELMRQFALRLNGSMTAGQALQLAKQAYFGELGAYGVYDEKALEEPVFYGLPMWRVGGPAVDANTAPPAPTVPAPDLGTPPDAGAQSVAAPSAIGGGVSATSVAIAPTFTKTTASSGRGTFWSVGGETQVTHYRPIQPRTSVRLPDATGLTPHGAWLTALTSQDNNNVNPVYARPTLDLSANEPEASISDTTFPTQFEQLTSYLSAGGSMPTRLVLLPGQFFAYAGSTQGTQRLFTQMSSDVFYGSPSSSFDPPTITRAQASYDTGNVTFTLDATPHGGATLAAALVLYHDATGWHAVDLGAPTGGEFSKTVAVSSSTIEWFGQVRDSNGNVGVTDDKGQFFGVQSQFASTVTGDLGASNWRVHELPTVDATGPASRYTVVVDGVGQGLVPQTIAEGTHRVQVRGNDGTTHDLGTIKVDVTPPTAALSPANFRLGGNGAYSVVCGDNASGVTDCPGGGTVDTTALGGGAIGPFTIHDAAGNATTLTLSYAVQAQQFFFLQPVNDPWGDTTGVQMSAFKAGSTIPLKFQLKNNQGVLIADSVAQSIASACGARLSFGSAPATAGPVTESTIASQPDNGGCFRYDSTADQFIYNLGTKASAFSPGNWALRVVVTATVANTPFIVGDHTVVVGLR